MSNYTKFHVGINIFVVKYNKLLLGKRKNIYGSGTWGLPGGHLEQKESMKEAAARELDEETGLKVDKLIFTNIVNDIHGNDHYLQIGFIAEGVKDEPQLNEPDRCEEWKWFDLNNLPDKVFNSHKNQIENFLNKKNFCDN